MAGEQTLKSNEPLLVNPHFVSRDGCPACGSPRRNTLHSIPYLEEPISSYLDAFYSPQGGVEFEFLQGAQWILDECQECGLIYQEQILCDAGMERLYGKWIDRGRSHELYERSHKPRTFVWNARLIAEVIEQLRRPASQLKFLDFGMGWGNWCLLAKGFGCQAFGAELAQELIERAGRNAIPVISWEEMPGANFDFIHSIQVFEHLARPLQVMEHLALALRPGGLMWISVPNGWDVKRRLAAWDWEAEKDTRNSLNVVAPLEHINCFDHRSLVGMAAKAGLSLGPQLRDRMNMNIRGRGTSIPFWAAVKSRLRPYYSALRGRPSVPPTELMFQKPVES